MTPATTSIGANMPSQGQPFQNAQPYIDSMVDVSGSFGHSIPSDQAVNSARENQRTAAYTASSKFPSFARHNMHPGAGKGIVVPIMDSPPDSTSGMDVSTDASGEGHTPSSHRGSSSNTSFSPANTDNNPSPSNFQPARQGQQNPSSPAMNLNSATPPATTTSARNPSNFYAIDEDFADAMVAQFSMPAQTPNFMSNDWNFPTPGTNGGGGTGMTPLASGDWDFNLGWDSMQNHNS